MFIDLLSKAIEKELEDKLWDKWIVQSPHMEEQISFIKYKENHFSITQKTSTKTDEEILEDAEKILKIMSGS